MLLCIVRDFPEDARVLRYSVVNELQKSSSNIEFFGNRLVPEHQPEKLPLADSVGLGYLKVEGNSLLQVPEMIFNLSEFPKFSGPRWPTQTGDGKKITFQGSFGFQPNVDEIFLATDNGQSVTRVTKLGDNYSGVTIFSSAISPNGKWVLFNANLYYPHPLDRPAGVYVGLVDVGSKTVELLGNLQGPGNTPIAWSSDSRFAVTSLFPAGSNKGPGQLHLIDTETKSIKQITFDSGMKEVIGWR